MKTNFRLHWRRNLPILLFFAVVAFFLGLLFYNLQHNLKAQNIASGLGFLKMQSGFEIGESVISYQSSNNYARALLVGLLNTLKVALIGNLLAVPLGFLLGIFRLAQNPLLSKTSAAIINLLRNIPLLLQLFFWYALFTEIFPSVRQAYHPLPGMFLCNRGLFIPSISHTGLLIMVLAFVFLLMFFLVLKKSRSIFYSSRKYKLGLLITVFILLLILVSFLLSHFHAVEYPVLQGFNFSAGKSISPEFASLLLGLVLYTSVFNAEIVRSGILSVKKGQWEAGLSLGLSSSQCLRWIVIPQSMRVIIPPLIAQMLNLAKNSSLAVAIGYPDFVSIANTSLNQTGQAVELVAIIMLVYLSISLITSWLMNMYNRKMAKGMVRLNPTN